MPGGEFGKITRDRECAFAVESEKDPGNEEAKVQSCDTTSILSTPEHSEELDTEKVFA
jgi:hypothetical protein